MVFTLSTRTRAKLVHKLNDIQMLRRKCVVPLKSLVLHNEESVSKLYFLSFIDFGFHHEKAPETPTPYLHMVQRLSILQPAVRGFGLGICFTFPHQSVINGRLDILRSLSQLRCSCKSTHSAWCREERFKAIQVREPACTSVQRFQNKSMKQPCGQLVH